MSLNFVARATARRNVADRFLTGLQQAQRQPNRREQYWLRQDLVSLEEGDYPAGEDALDKAQRALAVPEHAANNLNTNAEATCEELRDQLDRILNAG